MFWALLCPSSGARDYTDGYSMWYETLCLWLSLVWGGTVGYVSMYSNVPLHGHTAYSSTPDQRPATNKVSRATCCNYLYNLELLKMGIIVPETCCVDYKFNKPLCSIQLVFSPYIIRRCTVQHSSNIQNFSLENALC